MKDLKLGMKLLVTSTLYLDNVIFELVPTQLADAYTVSTSKEVQVKMTKGHWGACPTRNRSQVAINGDEVRVIANRLLEKHRERVADEKPKHRLYYIDSQGDIELKTLTFSRKYNSLSDGNYSLYTGGYVSLKVYDTPNNSYFFNLDEAIEEFIRISERYLKF